MMDVVSPLLQELVSDDTETDLYERLSQGLSAGKYQELKDQITRTVTENLAPRKGRRSSRSSCRRLAEAHIESVMEDISTWLCLQLQQEDNPVKTSLRKIRRIVASKTQDQEQDQQENLSTSPDPGLKETAASGAEREVKSSFSSQHFANTQTDTVRWGGLLYEVSSLVLRSTNMDQVTAFGKELMELLEQEKSSWNIQVELNKDSVETIAQAVYKDLCRWRGKSAVSQSAQLLPDYNIQVLESIRRHVERPLQKRTVGSVFRSVSRAQKGFELHSGRSATMRAMLGLAVFVGLISAGSAQNKSELSQLPLKPFYPVQPTNQLPDPLPVLKLSEPRCWTKWLDRDDPSGEGDFETLADLLEESPDDVCPEPVDVEALTLAGKTPAVAGDTVVMNVNEGFYCKNKDQKDKKCNDYKVRFSCPPEFCKPQLPDPYPVLSEPRCWTKWLDRGDPSGEGDFETLADLLEESPDDVCPKPVDVEALTLAGETPAAAGDTVVMNVNGFYCKNKDQKDKKCNDYKVRFSCPPEFCKPQLCWTQWFDRDDPSGTGDWETLADLQKQNPKQICDRPQQIEVVTTVGEHPALSTNQQSLFYIFNPLEGFVCKNSKTQRCLDYKVRFACCCEDKGPKP
uniref:WxxW domain-containing protein n=1 Tax=Knipowitschia caucasica TaxID=637954 RepID=A0AAV2KGN4_KNICA